jgi:UDP-glucose 4-epimerase
VNTFRGRHVVMTGGGGFIGSRLLERLVHGGAHVVLLGRDMGKSQRTAELVADGRVRFIRSAFTADDQSSLRDAFAGDDLLVLLGYVLPAASAPSARLIEEFALNVEPNIRLLDAGGDSVAQVTFASSVSVYGVPDRLPVPESAPLAPVTPYAVAKMASEHALRSATSDRGVPVAILRYSTVYGPGETVPRALPNFVRAALNGTDLRIDGSGLDRCDYVHVDDVVEATIRAIALRADGTFNVGTGIGTSTLEIARLVLEATGAQVDLVHGPARRPGPSTAFFCDTQLAAAELGFRARHELVSGIAGEVLWFGSRRATAGALITDGATA